jgi:hypothetical protein
MSAWGTNQMLRGGGLYRIRYTGRPLTVPTRLSASVSGVALSFTSSLDSKKAGDVKNYEVKTWDLVRSSTYGSDRYNEQTLSISKVDVNGKTVSLYLNDVKPVDVMTISYNLLDIHGNPLQGTVQNTIHNLSEN